MRTPKEPRTEDEVPPGSRLSDELTQVPGGRPEPSLAELAEGERIGRYFVLRKLGVGGMGVVYAAYDPELDRKVAIKLVHFRPGRSGDANRARLLREAQAMARVTHPNVATVHDVGTYRDQVYVAMEFVEGVTLAAWCTSTRPSWEPVIEVFDAAGRGLAAAHAQGLVHRDFTPQNVMLVERTGRVVVLDFGLARGSESLESGPEEASATIAGAGAAGLLSTEITQAGQLTGTPAYMSPEQFAGGDVDPLSDQFSFCVSLYQALYGERPFAGDTATALVWAVTEGKVREAPAGSDVPSWLRRIVLRGLSPKPSDRWPSVEALLAAIQEERPRRRRVVVWALAGALALASVGAAGWLGSRTNLCSGAEQHLDGVWDATRRDAANARVGSLALPWFERSWNNTVQVLDAYAQAWVATHEDACEATNRRGEQSAEMMDRRMACLDRARVELEAVTARLLTLDADGAGHVHELVSGLPPLSHCSDVSALAGEREPVLDASVAGEVEELRRELARRRAAIQLGENGHAQELSAMYERAMGIDEPRLRAELALVSGRALQREGELEPARGRLEDGLAIALAHDQVETAIAILERLVPVVGNDLQRPQEAMVYARVAEGLAARPGLEPTAARGAQLALANAYDYAGDYTAAEGTYRALLQAIPADETMERASALAGLGLIFETNGDLVEAERTQREVLSLYEGELGPGHPRTADVHSAIGNALSVQNRFEEAEVEHRRALEIDIAVFGPDHPAIAGSRANLGATLAAAGKRAEAEAEMREVLRLIGDDHPRTGLVLGNLGTLALDQGKDAEAEVYYRQALTHYRATVGLEHPRTVIIHSTLGVALDGQGKYAEGEAEQRLALRIALEAHGESHELVARVQWRLGENLLSQGRAAEAVEVLERSLAFRAEHEVLPERLGQTRYALARALWEVGRDRARARSLAEQAIAELHEAGSSKEADARSWLRGHSD